MQYYIDIEDAQGNVSRQPVESLSRYSLRRGGGGQGVNKRTVEKILRKEQCCPPALSQINNGVGQGPDEDLVIAGCDLQDESQYTVEVFNDVDLSPGATLPTINSFAVTQGDADNADILTISMDTQGLSSGDFYIIVVTNQCGGQTAFSFTILFL